MILCNRIINLINSLDQRQESRYLSCQGNSPCMHQVTQPYQHNSYLSIDFEFLCFAFDKIELKCVVSNQNNIVVVPEMKHSGLSLWLKENQNFLFSFFCLLWPLKWKKKLVLQHLWMKSSTTFRKHTITFQNVWQRKDSLVVKTQVWTSEVLKYGNQRVHTHILSWVT